MRPYGQADDDDNARNMSDTDRAGADEGVQPSASSSILITRVQSAEDVTRTPDVNLALTSSGYGDTEQGLEPAASGEMVDTSASDDPEEIRAGIEQTRTDMTGTINAIQEKLNPQALMDQAKDTLQDTTANILEQAKDTVREVTTGIVDNAKDTVREATVGRVEHMVSNATDSAKSTSSNVVELIKHNPLPAAALGLGLGWLFSRNKVGSSGNHGAYQPQNYGQQGSGQQGYGGQSYEQGYRDYLGGQGQNQQNMVDQVVGGIKQNPVPSAIASLGVGWWLMNRQGNAGSSSGGQHPSAYSGYRPTYLSQQQYGSQGGGVGDVVGRVQDKVGDIAGQASDTAGQVAGQVGDKASDVANKLGDVAGQAGEVVGSVAGHVGETAGNVAGAVAQTAGNVAGGTGNMAGNLLRTISQNPVPAAIVGAGIVWLLMRSNYSGQQTLNRAGDVAGDVASNAGDAVGNVAGAAGDAVGNVAGTVKEGTQQAQTQLQRMLMENPLAVGAVAAAVGVAVGLAIPETPQEHQLMGQTRDTLLDKAQTVAQDAMQKVQQVTDEAGRTIQEEAQHQGLV